MWRVAGNSVPSVLRNDRSGKVSAMVRLYMCPACRDNDHKNCDRSHPAPPGHYGGSKCICSCDGKPNFRKLQEQEAKEYFKWLMKLHAKRPKKRVKRNEIGTFTGRDGTHVCRVKARYRDGTMSIDYVLNGRVVRNAWISSDSFRPDNSFLILTKLPKKRKGRKSDYDHTGGG